MEAQRVRQVGVAGLAVWGVVLTIALLTGLLAPRWDGASGAAAPDAEEAPETSGEAHPQPGATPEPPGAGAADGQGEGSAAAEHEPAAAAAEGPSEALRHTVCERPEGRAQLALLDRPSAPPWLTLHCGSSVQVLAVEPTAQDELRFSRVLHLEPRASSGAVPVAPLRMGRKGAPEAAEAAPVLVPMLRMRPAHGLQEGKLYKLEPDVAGGFAAPRVWLPVGVSDLQTAEQLAGHDDAWVAMVPRPQLVPTPSEVWVVSGEASPQRRARFRVAPGAERLAVLDLDGDGQADLVTAGTRAPLELRRGTPEATLAEPSTYTEAVGIDTLTLAELSGDDRPDVLASGEGGVWLLRSGEAPTLEKLPVPPLRDLQVTSATAEAEGPSLVGYDHPRLLRVTRDGTGSWQSEPLTELLGDHVAVLQTQLADVDGSEGPELLVLTEDQDGAVAISVLRDPLRASTAQLSQAASAVTDAPLHMRFELP